MAITEAFTGTATISTTEYSLTNNSTVLNTTGVATDGVYQVWLDLSALTVTETYELRIYEKVTSAGTQRICYKAYFGGNITSQPHFVTPSMILLHGWEVSLDKLTGTDRSISWSIRQVA